MSALKGLITVILMQTAPTHLETTHAYVILATVAMGLHAQVSSGMLTVYHHYAYFFQILMSVK